jgi:hypothetical protein
VGLNTYVTGVEVPIDLCQVETSLVDRNRVAIEAMCDLDI